MYQEKILQKAERSFEIILINVSHRVNNKCLTHKYRATN